MAVVFSLIVMPISLYGLLMDSIALQAATHLQMSEGASYVLITGNRTGTLPCILPFAKIGFQAYL